MVEEVDYNAFYLFFCNDTLIGQFIYQPKKIGNQSSSYKSNVNKKHAIKVHFNTFVSLTHFCFYFSYNDKSKCGPSH